MRTKLALRQAADAARRARGQVALDDVLAPLLAEASRVAAYVAVGAEPSVAVRPGWLLPVVTEDWDLDWAVAGGDLVRRHGVLAPAGPLLGRDALAACDLVIVPALLVDVTGVRLGKGGGCYDRALRRATGLTVALVDDDELVDELPADYHDVRVAAVATPLRGAVRLPTKM